MSNLKGYIIRKCKELLDERIAQAQRMKDLAQNSANSDTKSSAGDKFETGREMAIQERNKAEAQLAQALSMKQALEKMSLTASDIIKVGSLVQTNQGNFFIAIALGPLEVEGQSYYVISGNSPIGSKLVGKKEEDSLEFNGRVFEIKSVT